MLRWKNKFYTTKKDLIARGRDEEIENFITFIKNLECLGIVTFCYNWMPVINWASSTIDRPSRGGARISAFEKEAVKDQTSMTNMVNLSCKNVGQPGIFPQSRVPEAENSGVKLALILA